MSGALQCMVFNPASRMSPVVGCSLSNDDRIHRDSGRHRFAGDKPLSQGRH
ncbi:hypothetical protein LJC71_06715 [Desulfosarcina sp. OttesenSCG-928-A07]|nr:hypothetical protein [Desulfosarcina sp. OttesenSCG-928-G17]MDL2329417.1 hypothetical protein [Desulfosarcina sp. OttesenSCG-928-A07]